MIRNIVPMLKMIGLILLFLLLLWLYLSFNKSNIINSSTIEKQMNDSIIKWKDKYNQEHSLTTVIIVNNKKQFDNIKSKDSTINKLKQLLNNESNKRRDIEVAMVITNQTVIKLKDSVQNAIIKYTAIKKNDSIYVYPTYTKDYTDNGKWVYHSIVIGPKEFNEILIINNDYDFVLGKETIKKGFLGIGTEYKTFAEITNKNPFSITKTMKVYQKIESKDNTKKKMLISGGIGILIGTLIKIL